MTTLIANALVRIGGFKIHAPILAINPGFYAAMSPRIAMRFFISKRILEILKVPGTLRYATAVFLHSTAFTDDVVRELACEYLLNLKHISIDRCNVTDALADCFVTHPTICRVHMLDCPKITPAFYIKMLSHRSEVVKIQMAGLIGEEAQNNVKFREEAVKCGGCDALRKNMTPNVKDIKVLSVSLFGLAKICRDNRFVTVENLHSYLPEVFLCLTCSDLEVQQEALRFLGRATERGNEFVDYVEDYYPDTWPRIAELFGRKESPIGSLWCALRIVINCTLCRADIAARFFYEYKFFEPLYARTDDPKDMIIHEDSIVESAALALLREVREGCVRRDDFRRSPAFKWMVKVSTDRRRRYGTVFSHAVDCVNQLMMYTPPGGGPPVGTHVALTELRRDTLMISLNNRTDQDPYTEDYQNLLKKEAEKMEFIDENDQEKNEDGRIGLIRIQNQTNDNDCWQLFQSYPGFLIENNFIELVLFTIPFWSARHLNRDIYRRVEFLMQQFFKLWIADQKVLDPKGKVYINRPKTSSILDNNNNNNENFVSSNNNQVKIKSSNNNIVDMLVDAKQAGQILLKCAKDPVYCGIIINKYKKRDQRLDEKDAALGKLLRDADDVQRDMTELRRSGIISLPDSVAWETLDKWRDVEVDAKVAPIISRMNEVDSRRVQYLTDMVMMKEFSSITTNNKLQKDQNQEQQTDSLLMSDEELEKQEQQKEDDDDNNNNNNTIVPGQDDDDFDDDFNDDNEEQQPQPNNTNKTSSFRFKTKQQQEFWKLRNRFNKDISQSTSSDATTTMGNTASISVSMNVTLLANLNKKQNENKNIRQRMMSLLESIQMGQAQRSQMNSSNDNHSTTSEDRRRQRENDGQEDYNNNNNNENFLNDKKHFPQNDLLDEIQNGPHIILTPDTFVERRKFPAGESRICSKETGLGCLKVIQRVIDNFPPTENGKERFLDFISVARVYSESNIGDQAHFRLFLLKSFEQTVLRVYELAEKKNNLEKNRNDDG